jgi:hypothetical protein
MSDLENLDDLSPSEIQKLIEGAEACKKNYDVLKFVGDHFLSTVYYSIFKPIVSDDKKYNAIIEDLLSKEIPNKKTLFEYLVAKFDPKIGYYRAAKKAESIIGSIVEAIKVRMIQANRFKIKQETPIDVTSHAVDVENPELWDDQTNPSLNLEFQIGEKLSKPPNVKLLRASIIFNQIVKNS